jgi:hypothetical protein
MFHQTRERPTAGRLNSPTLCRVREFATVARHDPPVPPDRCERDGGPGGFFAERLNEPKKYPRATVWQSFMPCDERVPL